jgi:hypothetical protein
LVELEAQLELGTEVVMVVVEEDVVEVDSDNFVAAVGMLLAELVACSLSLADSPEK